MAHVRPLSCHRRVPVEYASNVIDPSPGRDRPSRPRRPSTSRTSHRIGENSATVDRTHARVLDTEQGCRAGAVTPAGRDTLLDTRRQGRIEAAFRTTGGDLASGHILRLPDTASTRAARQWLQHTDLHFTTGPGTTPTGTPPTGEADAKDRYVVITSIIPSPATNAAGKADDTLHLLHSDLLVRLVFAN